MSHFCNKLSFKIIRIFKHVLKYYAHGKVLLDTVQGVVLVDSQRRHTSVQI